MLKAKPIINLCTVFAFAWSSLLNTLESSEIRKCLSCSPEKPTSSHCAALLHGFKYPSGTAKTGVLWWWLKGWIDEEGICADLNHMQNVGISEAVVFNAGPANTPTPFSTEFMSLRWRQLFRYAVEQAALRDIEIGLNLCDGWNSGGSWITEALAINPRRKTKQSGSGLRSFELDPFNPVAMDVHWENTVGKIINEADKEWRDKYVGKTFKYIHLDSWEGETRCHRR